MLAFFYALSAVLGYNVYTVPGLYFAHDGAAQRAAVARNWQQRQYHVEQRQKIKAVLTYYNTDLYRWSIENHDIVIHCYYKHQKP
jgi:hypothetical protein